MNKQISLSVLNDELLQVRTTKKEFLEKIERIIPFDEWIVIIEPYYYKGERGNKPPASGKKASRIRINC